MPLNIETKQCARIIFEHFEEVVHGLKPEVVRTMWLPKLNKLIEVMQIRGVKVFVHWSVLLIGTIILLGAVEDAPLAFTVFGSYYGCNFAARVRPHGRRATKGLRRLVDRV